VTYSIRIAADDGFDLSASVFYPRGPAVAAVIVNSATAVKRSYYARFAERLTADGFAVVTYDYRGIGGSRPKSLVGFPATMHQWGTLDFAAVHAWAKRELSPTIHVVGHSVGGQLLGLTRAGADIASAVLVGAQSGDWRLWPNPARYRMAFTFYLAIPLVTRAFGYLPGAVGIDQDLPRDVALEWAEWCRTPGHLVGGSGAFRKAGYARVRSPILGYSFTDDEYAPRAAVERLLFLYSNADRTHVHLRPRDVHARRVGHFGFFREKFEQSLWRPAIAWLKGDRRVSVAA
jgi:predicted alpha/beta hydrolase